MTFRVCATAGICAGALAAFIASVSVAGATNAQTQPLVKVADWEPLVLVGARFRPFERVVVRVAAAGSPTTVKRLRATRRGAFRVVLEASTVDRCSGPSILVTGAGGRVAKIRMPLPLCPPARP
jgi:hypothetical protein